MHWKPTIHFLYKKTGIQLLIPYSKFKHSVLKKNIILKYIYLHFKLF